MIFPYFHSVCLLSALLSLSTTFNGVVEFGGCIIHQQLWNNQPCLPDPWKGFLKNFYYGVANKISLGGDRRQECRRRLFCLRSSSRQTTKTPDSQLRLEPAALSEEAGCSRRERGRGGFLRRVTGSDPPEKEGTTGEVSSDDPRFPLTRTLAFIHSNPFTPCIFWFLNLWIQLILHPAGVGPSCPFSHLHNLSLLVTNNLPIHLSTIPIFLFSFPLFFILVTK